MFRQEMEQASSLYGLKLNEDQLDKFTTYYELLLAWNEKMNLTAITEEREFAVKHMIDSLTALAGWETMGQEGSLHLVDVGTGAGFPGLPLKIFCPELHLVLVDSLRKRVDFLETVVEKLALRNVQCLHMRAEEAARRKELRERFDVAVSRAVARLPVLVEYLFPFVRVGGAALALKGLQYREEIEEARRAVQLMGGREIQAVPVTLPYLTDKRAVVVMKKERPTPKAYPRKAGTPGKAPLL